MLRLKICDQFIWCARFYLQTNKSFLNLQLCTRLEQARVLLCNFYFELMLACKSLASHSNWVAIKNLFRNWRRKHKMNFHIIFCFHNFPFFLFYNHDVFWNSDLLPRMNFNLGQVCFKIIRQFPRNVALQIKW